MKENTGFGPHGREGKVQTLAGRVRTIRSSRCPNEDSGAAGLHVEVDDVLDVQPDTLIHPRWGRTEQAKHGQECINPYGRMDPYHDLATLKARREAGVRASIRNEAHQLNRCPCS